MPEPRRLTRPTRGSDRRDTAETAAARAAMVRHIVETAAGTLARCTGRAGLAAPVARALGRVPRHLFVPPAGCDAAYHDRPVPIGFGQTISQPFIVALMTELLEVRPAHRVLEVGTGSGYQAAILAEMAERVFGIETVPELAVAAERALSGLGYDNVAVRRGDGAQGWPEEAPFDGILVACATRDVDPALVDQLVPGGRLVAPLGTWRFNQDLVVIAKDAGGAVSRRAVLPVAFVPMVRPLGQEAGA